MSIWLVYLPSVPTAQLTAVGLGGHLYLQRVEGSKPLSAFESAHFHIYMYQAFCVVGVFAF